MLAPFERPNSRRSPNSCTQRRSGVSSPAQQLLTLQGPPQDTAITPVAAMAARLSEAHLNELECGGSWQQTDGIMHELLLEVSDRRDGW